MDTSKEYIKMCDCPEIRVQWKLKKGDCFSFVGDIHILADYEIDALNKRRTDIDCYNEVVKLMGGHFVDHWNECRDGFAWLPRQDQIQEMMGYGIGALVNDLYDFCETELDMFGNPDNLPDSMEQLWLTFYMHEKHKKKWDGKKWVAN